MFELYLLTFNCARNLVDPDALAPSLFDALDPTAGVPDLVAISLQEVSPIAYSFLGGSYLSPYFEAVTKTVHLAASLRGRDALEHVATRSLGMTALMIFAKPQFSERIQWIQYAGAGVGFWNMGNKGAVAMRLGVACPSSSTEVLQISLVAAHLAPMEGNIAARNKDWENVTRNLVFLNNGTSGYSSSEEQPLLSSGNVPPEDDNGLFTPGNHIFFAGDLNYRTHDKPPGPRSYEMFPQPSQLESSPQHYSHYLKDDQLTRERDANRTLHGLEELPITFPPTYKYSTRSIKAANGHKRSSSDPEQRWAWAKHRYPSWCDRILYVPPPPSYRLEPHNYIALPVQATSDHRPVALSVRVDDKPLTSHSSDDIRRRPPFPINPHWKTRLDNARRLEIIVGVLSYLTLTNKGKAMLVTFAGIALASWWIASRFS